MEHILTQRSLEWLERSNISSHYRGIRRLRPGDSISFNIETEVEPYVGVYAGSSFCEMGFMSFTNSPVPTDIVIGRYCSLGPGISFGGDRHPIESLSTSIFTHAPEIEIVKRFVQDSSNKYCNFIPNPQKPPVQIGHDVWVGRGAALLNGVTLGIGSVVAAHSVVTRPVQPYVIVGGNPAVTIRDRFSPVLVEELLKSEWWKYKFTDFSDFEIGSPERFLEQFSKISRSLETYIPQKIRLADIATI